MNDLDKYFEKARNVEPDISQDDTRKILAGILSDGGITTNLYHKIRTYPMITTLITSAAIVGILMLSQLAEPTNDNSVKQNKKTEITDKGDVLIPTEDDEPKEYDHRKEIEFAKKNPPKPTDELATKKPIVKNTRLDSMEKQWTDDTVDIKSVNSLTLNNDELEALGIIVNRDNFKVNAFNKYAFTIYANNEKDREYFDEDRDKDAFPTPAMVTTASGFKTLTLFKNDGIEAIVDRMKSDDGGSQSVRMTSEFRSEVDFDVNDDIPLFKVGQMTLDEYSDILVGHKDSAAIFNKVKDIQHMTFKLKNENVTIKMDELLKKNFSKYKDFDGSQDISVDMKVIMNEDDEESSEEIVESDNQSQNYSVANEEVNIDIEKILSQKYTNEEIEKIMAMDGDVIDVQIMYNDNEKREYIIPNEKEDREEFLKISSTKLERSSTVEPIVKSLKVYVDSAKINSMLNGTPLSDLDSNPDMLIGGDDEIRTITTLNIDKNNLVGMKLNKPGHKVWAYEDENDSNTTRLYSNMSFSIIKHDINKLIPIEVSLSGDKTDFIVWYEATDEFLEKLPSRLIQKINPELNAADDQAEHCDNEPVKKDDAVMDVWSGCSGAIKGMKLYPNPAVDQSSVELSLEEDRNLSIAIYNLSGKLIKRIGTPTQYSKGQLTKPLDLSGINPGLYYVVVKSEIGEQALQRIIIE